MTSQLSLVLSRWLTRRRRLAKLEAVVEQLKHRLDRIDRTTLELHHEFKKLRSRLRVLERMRVVNSDGLGKELRELTKELRVKLALIENYIGDLNTVASRRPIEIQVVSCFVKHDDKILLLRRSSNVGSFQGYWSGVSGYIEKGQTPFNTAITEIEEETGLKQNELKLIATGKPIKVKVKNQILVIHPLLFETRRKNIKLDWEHESYKWVLPSQLANYKIVPGLQAALKSVLKF